jgi:hypothetical protein
MSLALGVHLSARGNHFRSIDTSGLPKHARRLWGNGARSGIQVSGLGSMHKEDQSAITTRTGLLPITRHQCDLSNGEQLRLKGESIVTPAEALHNTAYCGNPGMTCSTVTVSNCKANAQMIRSEKDPVVLDDARPVVLQKAANSDCMSSRYRLARQGMSVQLRDPCSE